nr:MAG TPA: hypothetical protein [Caudoviricetes sp.]
MKEQFTYNGHDYKRGDKIRIVSTYDSRKYNDDTLDDVGNVYTILGWLDPDDKDSVPERLIQVERHGYSYRDFITKWDEFEPYTESTILPLNYTLTSQQQEKLCKRYGKDIDNMTGTELLDLLSFHLDNILVEGLE